MENYCPLPIHFTSEGTKTLYAWTKDATGNVSASESATVVISLPDNEKPVILTFTIPANSTSLTINITSFNASDNKAIAGFMLSETSSSPNAENAGWKATAPSSYTFTSEGTKTLYAWAKDAAGNVSESKSATVIISLLF
ncbi:MAG: hypothetical protein IPF54_27515 [Draconibacterium sp.]|nr:hypothetical protein [Draconibacterium sp.]